MKKNLLIVLPSLVMCVVLAVCICIAVFWDFGDGADEPDNLIHPHELTLVEEKQATCTEEGHTAYYFCEECDKWFSDADGKIEITDKASVITTQAHNFVNGECDKCGAEHDCQFKTVVTPPTCIEAGFTTYECACGLSYKDNFTEPAQHNYSNGKCRICGAEHDCEYVEEVTLPTCTERGFTLHKCTCGNSYIGDYTPTLGHDYVDAICTRCGKIFGAVEYKFYNDYYMCTGIDSAFDIEDITELIIPSTYRGYPVKGIEDNAFEQCVYLTKITLNDGITSIGNYAFNKCNLASITFPDSLKSIGNYAFNQCKLTSITLPDSLESIGGYAFQNCTKLESVTFSENLKSIGTYAFDGCTSLTGIALPDSVGSIGEAAFSACTSLADVRLGNGLKTINLWLFYDCPALTRITIPDSVVIVYAYAFSKCTNLTTVDIPGGLTVLYRNAFSNTAITDIYYDGTVSQWLDINKGENWDLDIADYTVHCTDGDYNKNSTFGLSYTLSGDGTYYICSGIGTATDTNIAIASTYNYLPVRAIGEGAFMNRENLTSMTIPDSVTSIGLGAFQNCKALTEILVPDSVTVIENYAFYGCTSLKEITVPAGVTALESYTFTSCTKLERIIYKGTMDEWNAIPHTGWLYLNNCTIECTDGQFKSGHR